MANGITAVTQARAALDALAEALVSGDADRVLANEQALAAAAADLVFSARAGVAPANSGEALMWLAHLRAARAALERCRALGATAADLTAAMFAPPTGYSSSGTLQAAPTAVPFFSSRI
jgi:hypothetical protein